MSRHALETKIGSDTMIQREYRRALIAAAATNVVDIGREVDV
jgi:hypothetical protein